MADLPPLATLEQLAVRLGYLPEGTEADRANGLLVDASELIRDEADVTWVNDQGALVDVPRRVVTICVDVAHRAFVNPEGLNQRSIGDSSKSYDRAGREGGEAVYLTKTEAKAVRKAAAAGTFRAVTLVSPWAGDDATDSLLGS